MDTKISSYTAANSIPIKIFKNEGLTRGLQRKIISPQHVQLIPTNKCNLNCDFCSCRKRNKHDELKIDEIRSLIKKLYILGCKAVTITGGGEPLMHPDINEVISEFSAKNIKIGLVTNGLLLNKLDETNLSKITWCRISCADGRVGDDHTLSIIKDAVSKGKNVDWAFSYVLSDTFDNENLNRYVTFATDQNFTHVRVVSDLCNLDTAPDMAVVKRSIKSDDRLVIYQGRKTYDPGQKDCWISLLKPTIGADGRIYPCCGVQYAHQEQDLDLPENMCMGHISEIETIWRKGKPFNGLQCARCYYKNYNDILGAMLDKTEHLEFV